MAVSCPVSYGTSPVPTESIPLTARLWNNISVIVDLGIYSSVRSNCCLIKGRVPKCACHSSQEGTRNNSQAMTSQSSLDLSLISSNLIPSSETRLRISPSVSTHWGKWGSTDKSSARLPDVTNSCWLPVSPTPTSLDLLWLFLSTHKNLWRMVELRMWYASSIREVSNRLMLCTQLWLWDAPSTFH